MARKVYHLVILLTLLLSSAGGCKSFDTPELNFGEYDAECISIATLCSQIDDKPITITEDLVIEGYVVSDDKESNFHKTFVINDKFGGVEIMAGIYDLHDIYPEGEKLYIALKGCTLARHYGVVQVGMKSESYSGFQTDYFASRVLLDKHIIRSSEMTTTSPKELNIEELRAEDCGLLVKVSNVKLISEEFTEQWKINTEGKWQGYNIFSDENGNKIAVYTSDYASYAKEYIPSGTLSITGILQHGTAAGEDMFMIKMRREDDCRGEL